MNEQVIRALIAKWRDAAVWEHDDMSNVQSAQTFDQCADELEALLAAGDAAETPTPRERELANALTRIRNVMRYVPERDVFEISPIAWFSQRYMSKNFAKWLDAILAEAASLSPAVPTQEPTATPAPAPHPAPSQNATSAAPSAE